MKYQYAIIVDTDFIYKILKLATQRNVSASHILTYADRLKKIKYISAQELLVTYFNTGGTEIIDHSQLIAKYMDIIAQKNQKNQTSTTSTMMKSNYFMNLKQANLKPQQKFEMLERSDEKKRRAQNEAAYKAFVRDIQEKGVDMAVSLDLAMLALREMVFSVIVATQNADYIPAFKFVRSLGVQVILDTLGCPVAPELAQNADLVINSLKQSNYASEAA